MQSPHGPETDNIGHHERKWSCYRPHYMNYNTNHPKRPLIQCDDLPQIRDRVD